MIKKNKLPKTEKELIPIIIDCLSVLFSVCDGNAFHSNTKPFKNWMDQYNNEAYDILYYGVEVFLKNNQNYNNGIAQTPNELKKLLKTIKTLKKEHQRRL